jgi:hypothetical protein
VNILDENILESQRQLLKSWSIPVRQIGIELGRKGMADEEILPFLLTLPNPTLFTRDSDFWELELCHNKRCLVVLEVRQYEAAHFIRDTLRHPNFNTQAKRMGTVIRSHPIGLTVFRRNSRNELHFDWPK